LVGWVAFGDPQENIEKEGKRREEKETEKTSVRGFLKGVNWIGSVRYGIVFQIWIFGIFGIFGSLGFSPSRPRVAVELSLGFRVVVGFFVGSSSFRWVFGFSVESSSGRVVEFFVESSSRGVSPPSRRLSIYQKSIFLCAAPCDLALVLVLTLSSAREDENEVEVEDELEKTTAFPHKMKKNGFMSSCLERREWDNGRESTERRTGMKEEE
jgi:hypothetical protein